DGLLDLGRRQLVDLDARLFAGEQHDAARVAEHHCGPHVLRVKNVFHGERVGRVAREELAHAVVNLPQPRGEWIARARADGAAFDKGDEPRPVSLYDTIPGGRGAGIDAENDHPSTFAISATSMSKFAQTFCTSSSSSIVSSSLSNESASLPATCTV